LRLSQAGSLSVPMNKIDTDVSALFKTTADIFMQE
jgi:hypothetical protein